ncbi:hypothetical protein TEA_005817 [Camellia sinensis var. sinensis]|uniref:Phosphoglycerate mutase-like protein 4 n=1 Tax=Camellia sinensis var. sinensis TaxID=542762 RepID=A0A4S4EUT4_CAMSN|nr:hypothetical protein TEA_005817 [Camellia sinensis var. sinensis]
MDVKAANSPLDSDTARLSLSAQGQYHHSAAQCSARIPAQQQFVPASSQYSFSIRSSSLISKAVLHQFGYNGDSTSESNESAAYAEIVVIRHGETEFNATKRMQGQLDVELNNVGRAQATAVAHRLSRERKVSIVYSSDLKRALDTAEAIASSCGGLEGGGESLDQLYDRCTSVLERIGSKHKGERVVMVTHGGVIRTLYELASPSGQPGRVLNTSVNIFHLSDGDIWTIKSWGDVSHLSQTEYLESGFGGDTTSG